MKNYLSSSRMRILLCVAFLTGMIGVAVMPLASAQATNTVQNVLCGVITSISQILSILALMLFILGGTLYAFAHFLPAAGNFRGNLQGWGMGMLMGGIIALILYIAAPFIINQIISVNTGSTLGGGTGTNTVNAPSLSGGSCSGGIFSGVT